jgi:hypothetical protein
MLAGTAAGLLATDHTWDIIFGSRSLKLRFKGADIGEVIKKGGNR